MAIYAVHSAPPTSDPANLENARFVKQGFSRAGLVFGPLWLVRRRLWRALALWAAFAIVLIALVAVHTLSAGAGVLLLFLGDLYIGLEGAAWRSSALVRRGFPLVDVVSGRDLQEAERSFFARVLASPSAASPFGPRPPASSPTPQVIGLFPEPGR